MESLVRDLKKDTAEMNQVIAAFPKFETLEKFIKPNSKLLLQEISLRIPKNIL